VAVGEYLGYLFTGVWTALAGVALIQSDCCHRCWGSSGWSGAAVCARLAGIRRPVRGARLELAGALVPFAYIGWSVWLLALGIGLLITA
jgi:hypothetical protein